MRKGYIPPEFKKIFIVGIGGTGSYLAQGLAKMISGYKLNIDVTLVDPDIVEKKNCARQNFEHYEIGEFKAEALSTRLNLKYGLRFGFVNDKIESIEVTNNGIFGRVLYVTCLDKVSIRKKFKTIGHWLDLGNGKATGQAIYGNTGDKERTKGESLAIDTDPNVKWIPNPYLAVKMWQIKNEPDVPSCANMPFEEQGCFVNEWAAQAGLTILHQLLITGILKTPRIYFDCSTGRMNPVFITKETFKDG